MKYMMMETVVYAREFLYMKELYDNGDLGKLQFLRQPSAGHGWVARLLAGLLPCIMPPIVWVPFLEWAVMRQNMSLLSSGTREEMHGLQFPLLKPLI